MLKHKKDFEKLTVLFEVQSLKLKQILEIKSKQKPKALKFLTFKCKLLLLKTKLNMYKI